jgi:transcriptional regulator with XRE-family HTH domain
MPESKAERGARRASALLQRTGVELRLGRHMAGLTLERVGDAVGVSASELSRIERGLAPWVDLGTLGRIANVVGLDLWVRVYPGGEPVRDAASPDLLNEFRGLLGPRLRLRAEVPIGDPRDLRAWDLAIIEDGGLTCGVELDTRLVDAQAQLRRMMLKRRDGEVDRVLWVIADTRANRQAVGLAANLFGADLSLDADEIRAALAAGRIPPRDGLILVPFPRSDGRARDRRCRPAATGDRTRRREARCCRVAARDD